MSIVPLARRGLLIIADEIYANLVFPGTPFFPLASLTETVPVLEVGGLAKEFLVPGFRVGWIVIHDTPAKRARGGEGLTALREVRSAILKLSQLIIGANTLVQACLPTLLTPPRDSEDARMLMAFQKKTVHQLATNAQFLVKRLRRVPGLTVGDPQGAMYVMVGLPEGTDDVEFAQALLNEELLFVLPGSCFGIAGFVRIVFCAPAPVLAEACDRLTAFCKRRFTQ